jgi:hypothetical protein
MHRHRPKKTVEYGFTGPVTAETSGYYAQNQRAHGNICVVATCSCGATRRTNVNQWHIERGRWKEPKTTGSGRVGATKEAHNENINPGTGGRRNYAIPA